MGREAVDALIELIESGEARPRRLECAVAIRESCGCRAPLPLPAQGPGEAAEAEAREVPFLAAIGERAAVGDAEGAVRALERALAPGIGDPTLISRWRSLLFGLRAEARIDRPADSAAPEAPSWFDQALARLEEIGRNWEVDRARKAGERNAAIIMRCHGLLGQFSLGRLVRSWDTLSKSLGAPRGYLVLFDGEPEPGGVSVPARSRLVEASPSSQGIVELRFPTERLLPDEIRRRGDCRAWIVAPLVYQEEALGYLLYESGGCEPEAYEMLREIMSSSIKGALLLEEIADNKSGLERQVYFRTIELQEANRGLLDQIELRKELEREVRDISNRTMQAIGQDLHDDLCPYLAGISMFASILEERLALDGSESAEAAREIHELLRGALDRSRRYARTLYPPRLAEEGIASALEELVEAQGKAAGGTSIAFQAEGDFRIDDVDKSLNLFRIVQEALSNALSHSGSDDVIVRLAERNGSLLAEVRDFGRGMSADGPGREASESGRGMGLKIMRYRAEAIGASLEIESLNPGTRVSCVLARG